MAASSNIEPARMVLALDHLTAIDAAPLDLVSLAVEVGCAAVCLFLHPMAVLPRLPSVDLVGDLAARRALKARCDDLGVGIELAYPFTLTGRIDLADFIPALDAAAELGVRAANILNFDREPARRADRFAGFCDLARARDLGVAVEFFPGCQVRTLADALDLTAPIGRPGQVGVNLDLLHLVRSGGTYAEVAAAPPGLILYAQLSDGPVTRAEADWAWEASFDRLPPGEGAFDLSGFLAVLPADVRLTVEVPREAATAAGVSARARVEQAVEGARRALRSRAVAPASGVKEDRPAT
jgi:sugar phosphate isomerase/epimerase